MKKALLILSILLLFFVTANGETFTVGSRGENVLRIKKRLLELNYYSQGVQLTQKYTEDTAEKVSDFQSLNSLPVTGELSEADWDILFSDSALPKPPVTPEPFATPAPTPEVAYPALDEKGYLLEEGVFYYENAEAGLWVAKTRELQVTITRREDSTYPLVWFETEIRFRGSEHMQSYAQKRFAYPYDIAQEQGMILAFSDDFYGYRIAHKEKAGIIIRNGELIRNEPASKNSYRYPNLDMLIESPQGNLTACKATDYTAEELTGSGAVNVLSFGPVVIHEGEPNREALLSGHYSSKEPRQVLGMIEPGHYFLVTVVGRSEKSRGTDLWHVAGILMEEGVQEALNLDGGNTAALIFHGKLLNKEGNSKAARTVNSLLYFGIDELKP